MEFESTSASGGFEREQRTENSSHETPDSTIAKLTRKRAALRDEVSSLRKQSKNFTDYLRKQTTCNARNAEIEEKIDFVCGDMELLETQHKELEAEIATLQMHIESVQCNRALREETGDDMGVLDDRAISCYEKILQFRLDNEIFDDDFPALQTLERSLSECTEFKEQIKALRRQLSEPSTEEDLNSTAGRSAYRETLRSYIEHLLHYYENQLSRVKLVALRLRKATR